jgi:hypothetical protein
MGLLLLILILILVCGGGLPHWGYHSYGYYPSGGAGLLVVLLVIWLLLGRG